MQRLMNESFLHYVWQYQYFSKHELSTTSGDTVTVFQPGILNSNSGPDFSSARIKIGDLEWRGNVEVHIYASDWSAHGHQDDSAYDNVVLHVVWEEDKLVQRRDGSRIPTLELKNRVEDKMILNYRRLVANPAQIPCANALSGIEEVVKLSTIDKALMTRLEWKAHIINQILRTNQNDWEETTYQLICRNLGFKTNADAMESLSRAVPYRLLLKHADQPTQVEALLYGQSGLLDMNDPVDSYAELLVREFGFLSHKYQLGRKQMNSAHWKFLRMRPPNFPTIRIAQLSSLVGRNRSLFSGIINLKTVDEAIELFKVKQSAYWCEHYHFGKPSSSLRGGMGVQSIQILIINVVVPILVCYGRLHDDQVFVDRAVDFLENLPGERNAITVIWKDLGFKVRSANDSQALIELYNNYCQRKRCLHCGIGAAILKP